MNVFYKGLIVTTAIICSFSCNKFLDTKPLDFNTPENFYKNEAQLNSALATVYSILGENYLYGQYMLTNGFEADEAYDVEEFGPAAYNVSTTDPEVANFWRLCYVGINRANLLLENINKPEMNENNRKAIKGETLFLRAYYFFMLVRTYGDVPLKLEYTQDGLNTIMPRTPYKEVYAQIIKDLEEADTLVRSISSIGHGGRINRSAVRGMLARVNLYMAGKPYNDPSRYAEVLKWTKAIIDEGYHQLNPDYAQIFINYSADKYDPKESIWELEFFGNTQAMWREAGRVGTYSGIAYTGDDPNHGYSYGSTNASGALWIKYPNENLAYSYDMRRDVAIAPYTLSGNPAVRRYTAPTTKVGRDCGKYRREYEVVMPKEKNYSPVNFPMIRYSDVLLMYAEAENAINGPTADAIEKVNMVRRRGYGKYLNGYSEISESIDSLKVSAQGSGYKSAPVVQINGGGGDGTAKGTAVLSSGRVTAITIVNPGIKFKSVPEIVLIDTNKTKATTPALAYAVLTKTNNADLAPTDYSSKEVFLTTIQEERARELCMESLRKGDLIRWDIFLPTMKNVLMTHEELAPTSNSDKVPYRNASARDVLWPIPSYEIGLNPALTQNLGW